MVVRQKSYTLLNSFFCPSRQQAVGEPTGSVTSVMIENRRSWMLCSGPVHISLIQAVRFLVMKPLFHNGAL
ncbi:MAG TPA: hypothetical protein PKV86_08260 [Syntrophobacteraceae bacterium]|nr:hypothetical protein [Syntrophobacteraceae bacterium]